jgi:tetratricopeptide (TPR) repeat protein
MVGRYRLASLTPAALCLAVLIFSGLRGAAQVENGAITGQITIARGSFPPDRIKVTLETRGIIVNETWTDDEGKFKFLELSDNLYHVTIDDEKYEPYKEIVKVNAHINPNNILSIRLTPKEPSTKESTSPVTGENPYLTDLADYEKRFPGKVVKEFNEGVKSQADGRMDDATRHFQAVLKLAPDFYPAHNNLGTVYLRESNFPAAQGEFEIVLRLKPSDTEAYFNLGNVFLLTKRYDEASHNIQEGLRKQPNSALGNFLLGSVYQQTGGAEEAEHCLRRALEMDPGMTTAHLVLVNLYLRQGRTSDAIAELKLFLRAAPSDPFAPKAREVLKKLQPDVSSGPGPN